MSWGGSDSKMKWGDDDMEGDDDKDSSKRAPRVSTFTSAPDKDGIKTVTEFRTDEDGKKIQIIRKVKEIKQIIRVNRHVLERRKWKKFGDCANTAPGPEPNITYVSNEHVNLQLKPRKREEEEEDDNDPLDKLKGSDSVVVCRHCKETGHWTLRCPKRVDIIPTEKSRPNEGPRNSLTGMDTADGALGASATGKYIPVHLRGKGGGGGGDNSGGGGRGRDDEGTTIRVTNISEDTTEDDLRELFRRFGHTSRIFLAKDRQTNVSRGFAFISYAERADAQKAIDKLNGHGYDNLILHVEFAKPREEGGVLPSAGSIGAGKSGWTMKGTM